MSASIIVAFITGVLGPVLLLFIKNSNSFINNMDTFHTIRNALCSLLKQILIRKERNQIKI